MKLIPIQDLSKQTGITVRTRYYDQIGLLIPAAKTLGKHRIYSDEELKKRANTVSEKAGLQFARNIGYDFQPGMELVHQPDESVGLRYERTKS